MTQTQPLDSTRHAGVRLSDVERETPNKPDADSHSIQCRAVFGIQWMCSHIVSWATSSTVSFWNARHTIKSFVFLFLDLLSSLVYLLDCRHGSRPFVRYERLLLEIGRLVDGVKASVSCRGSSFSLVSLLVIPFYVWLFWFVFVVDVESRFIWHTWNIGPLRTGIFLRHEGLTWITS